MDLYIFLMFFTNSYFLIGLGFILIPILINFLIQKQYIVKKFPTLLFLKKTFQKESRRLRWQEILLLLIRTLIIFFLVLSLARPFLTVKNALSALSLQKNKKKSVVFILDNSYSMGLIGGSESLWNKAKRLLLKIMETTIKDQDNSCLVLSADVNRNKFFDLTFRKGDVIQNVKNASLSYLPNNLFDAILRAEKILDKSDHSQRFIYLISDMQSMNFKKEKDFLYSYMKCQYPLFFLKIDAKEMKNSAIIHSTVPVTLTLKKETGALYTEIKNFSPVRNNLILRTMKDKEPIHQQSISLSPYEKTTSSFLYIVDSSGYIPFTTEIIDGDNLIQDNRNYFVLYVPEQVRLDILDLPHELMYVLNAVNPGYVLNKSVPTPLKIQEVKNISSGSKADLLLINYSSLSTEDIKSVRNFLTKKINVLLFPSLHLDINNFNSVFSKTLNLNCGFSTLLHQDQNPATVEYVDYSHPIFSLFKDIKIFRTEKIFTYYKMNINTMSMNLKVLARFNNNDPAILELRDRDSEEKGFGRIILFTFLPARSSTDLIYSPNFPALIQQMIKYLVNPSPLEQMNRFTVGQSLDDILSLLDLPPQRVTQVAGEPDYLMENRIIKPGIYQAHGQMFSVNLNYDESDVTPLSVEEIKKNYKGLKIIGAEKEDEANEMVSQYGMARPLTKSLFILILLLLISEMLLRSDTIQLVQGLRRGK